MTYLITLRDVKFHAIPDISWRPVRIEALALWLRNGLKSLNDYNTSVIRDYVFVGLEFRG